MRRPRRAQKQGRAAFEVDEGDGKVLDVDELVADIAMQGKPVMSFPDADTIIEHLLPELRDGDVVAIMSNGGFGGIHDKLLDRLKTLAS